MLIINGLFNIKSLAGIVNRQLYFVAGLFQIKTDKVGLAVFGGIIEGFLHDSVNYRFQRGRNFMLIDGDLFFNPDRGIDAFKFSAKPGNRCQDSQIVQNRRP